MEQQTSGNGYGKRPLWQWIVLYVILAVIAYGFVYRFLFSQGGYGYTSSPSQTYAPPGGQTSQSNPPPQNLPSNTQPPNSQNRVTYTDAGFSPSILTVKKGDTVIFKNAASDDMWVTSNPHPVHNEYPTTGGCVASTFDSCHAISPGESWSFKFDIVGKWGYHNHLNPSEGGTIVVQ